MHLSHRNCAIICLEIKMREIPLPSQLSLLPLEGIALQSSGCVDMQAKILLSMENFVFAFSDCTGILLLKVCLDLWMNVQFHWLWFAWTKWFDALCRSELCLCRLSWIGRNASLNFCKLIFTPRVKFFKIPLRETNICFSAFTYKGGHVKLLLLWK